VRRAPDEQASERNDQQSGR